MSSTSKDGVSRSLADFQSRTGCNLLRDPRPDIQVGDIYVLKKGESKLRYLQCNLKDVIKPRGATPAPPFDIKTMKFQDKDQDSDFSTLVENKFKVNFVINAINYLKAKIRVKGNIGNTDFNRLKYYFRANSRERIKSTGDINRELTYYSFDPSAYKFDFGQNSYWIVTERLLSKNFAICSIDTTEKSAGVLVEFSKQFEASAGRDVKIEGHQCCTWNTRKDIEIVFALCLAHLNNQLVMVDIQVDPATTPPPGISTLLGVARTSGGIIEPHRFKKPIKHAKSIPEFYTTLEINESMNPVRPNSMLVLDRD